MRLNFSNAIIVAGFLIAAIAGYQYWLANQQGMLPEVPQVDLTGALPHIRGPIEAAYKAVRSSPRDPDATVALGALLHAYFHYDAAAIAYQRAVLLQPDDFRWRYLLAIVESLRGNESAAIAGLEAALRIDGENYPAAKLNLAELLFGAGDHARSEELFVEILDDRSLGIWANYGYGRLLLARGDEQAARAQLRQAVERYPNFGSAHYELALIHRRTGNTNAATEHLALYEKYKNSPPPRVDQLLFRIAELNDNPAARVRKGTALAAQGKHVESIAEFRKALEYEPGHLGALSWLIREHGRLGQLDEAEANYRQALDISPGWPAAHIYFGTALVSQGQNERAIDVLSLAVAGNPHSAYAFLQRGIANEKTADTSAAIADYLQVIALEPDHSQAHALLGRQLAVTGQTDEAIVHLSRAILQRGEQTPALESALAVLYLKQGDRKRALSHFEQALADAGRYGQEETASAIRTKIRQLSQGEAK